MGFACDHGGSMKSSRPRSAYVHFTELSTRWMDNDVYGHVNNVVYYSFFDTAVNGYLIAAGCLDIRNSPIVGLVVETGCQYFKPIAFPDALLVGIRVAKLGTSSVRYEIGIFLNGDESAAAEGYFVHVYVDRAANKSVPIPDHVRKVLSGLLQPGEP
jgi:acyl-CoA thioester hydrolase